MCAVAQVCLSIESLTDGTFVSADGGLGECFSGEIVGEVVGAGKAGVGVRVVLVALADQDVRKHPKRRGLVAPCLGRQARFPRPLGESALEDQEESRSAPTWISCVRSASSLHVEDDPPENGILESGLRVKCRAHKPLAPDRGEGEDSCVGPHTCGD